MRRLLDAHGFQRTESHLNEWNYLPGNSWDVLSRDASPETRQRAVERMAGAHGGAFLAAALIELQDAPVDVCNFYHGGTGIFGVFTEVGFPTRNYHALLAFAHVLDTPKRVRTAGGVPGKLAVAAGIHEGNTKAAVLVANLAGGKDIRLAFDALPWDGATDIEVRLVDEAHALQPIRGQKLVASQVALTLPPPYVALVTLHPAAAR